MSNNRCGYCYERGHNRTTCPKMKKNYKIAMTKNKAERSYSDIRAIREYEDIQRKKKKNRRCTYCDQKGHNRTTCPSKKRYFALHERASRIAQNIYIDTAISTGQFYGSLIEVTRNAERPGYRQNGKNVYFLNKMPSVTPLLVSVVRLGEEQWRTVYPNSETQERESIKFYKSEEYLKLYKLAYLANCSYKNVRLLGGSENHGDIPCYDVTQVGQPWNKEEQWKYYPASDIKPEQVWKKIASQWQNLPLYKGYTRSVKDLSIWTVPVPQSIDESSYSESFRKMLRGDFMSEITGYCTFHTDDIYCKKSKHNPTMEKQLRHYIEALSSEYEHKHF